MQTNFTPAQLADPAMAASEKILRTCVHCGFCTATCPTYQLLGDELDSPRGRIYLIKDMFETGKPATPEVVKHVDRCLSCLSCMTTCPSGVHYMHLVDHARAHIEQTYRRPLPDRLMRGVLAAILPYPNRFRLALAGGFLARKALRLASLLRWKGRAAVAVARHGTAPVSARTGLFRRAHAMIELAPLRLPSRSHLDRGGVHPAQGSRRGRVAILKGCAQSVLAPSINEAAVRLLTRLGVEVVFAKGEGCCGALVHHMGKESQSHAQAKRAIDAWIAEMDGEGLDAVVITASGCGTTIKDYGFMFRDDPAYADKAARVSAIAKDVTEYLATLDLPPAPEARGLTVAYHSACSMQHGQGIKDLPVKLLKAAGFTVKEPAEGHLCCGSAGVYNIMQPEIATRLRDRKIGNLDRAKPDLIAAGNIGCITQIAEGYAGKDRPVPIVHTVELIDWVHGGPLPEALERAGFASRA
ncbi:heterodisulfide reductase-related iron-sulfur binding cluster [Phreatobacter sp.]|uniref:heterodisulfide reductase-related iron-sulfur binding cluster n=1 Tax=Phreatobacter sp. TaxID=1966341 RepID=UPI003F6FF1C1